MSEQQSPQSECIERQRLHLADGEAAIKSLSASLDTRITSLQKWFADTPGKVEAEASVKLPDDPATSLRIRLSKPNWVLEARLLNAKTGARSDWKPLLSAGLNIKMAAVEAFPLLLSVMQDMQTDLITRLATANEKFDSFAVQAGVKIEEGA